MEALTASQDSTTHVFESYPARREFSQLGFNHSIATDLLAKVRSESPEKALPFFIDGLMEMSIAVTDRSLAGAL